MNQLANEIGLEAINVLRNYTSKINMEYESYKPVLIPAYPDKFYPMDVNSATDGVIIMGLDEVEGSGSSNLIKIPPDGAVYRHFHKKLKESVMVIIGCINYIVYATDKRSKIIKEGKLHKGEILEIDPMQTHYVFTSETTSYALVNFEE